MEIKISDQLNGIIKYAREEAMRTGSYGIGPDHLFLGLIRHEDNTAFRALRDLGLDPEELNQFIDGKIFTNETIPYSEIDNINFSRMAQNVLSITIMEATRLKSREAGAHHLLLALCRSGESYGQVSLRNHGIDYGRILSYLEDEGLLLNSAEHDEKAEPAQEGSEEAGGKKEKFDIGEYGYDLTRAAREGKLDPVVGRDMEIARLIEILGRRKKNNPMLIGEPGVGKSAIVEGLALRIASGEISPALAKKQVLSLDIASVVAGTKFRGDFEKRLKAILAEAAANPDLILFIDEFHVVLSNPHSAAFFDSAWKQMRKRNAYPTAITQNVDYLMQTAQGRSMLSNSEFVVMFNQAEQDQEVLARLMKLSPEQMHYVKNANAGSGLIKCGRSTIPFDNHIPSNLEIYNLMNTTAGEWAA